MYLKLTAVEMSQRIENRKNIWEATATRQFILRSSERNDELLVRVVPCGCADECWEAENEVA